MSFNEPEPDDHEVDIDELKHGIDIEEEDEDMNSHPTPNRPSGRAEP